VGSPTTTTRWRSASTACEWAILRESPLMNDDDPSRSRRDA
jgi:hypothetical protein